MSSETSEKIIIPVTVEKKDPPYIPANASFKIDAEGGMTYHFTSYVLELNEHTVYVSKDRTHFIEEIEVPKNGKILKSQRTEILNGLKDGLQEYYDKKGRLMERVTYRMGIKEGPYEQYSIIDGNLAKKGAYKNGKKEGKWTYFGFGPDIKEITFLNGKYDGEVISYTLRNGEKQLSERKNYINGNLSGICEYFLAGYLYKKVNYLNGKKDGIYVKYNMWKEPEVIGEYSNGQKTGEWTFYLTGNLVQKTEHYKDGKRHGICKSCYYRPSKKFGIEIDHVIENNYVDDLLDGQFPYREFDHNGTVILEGNLIDGRKEGVWNHYQNNELVGQDFYSQGTLVGAIKSNIPALYHPNTEKVSSDREKREVKIRQNGDYIYKYETIGEVKDGLYQEFDCNEHLIKEGYYSAGKEIGIWKTYNEEGSLFSEIPYNNGVILGIIKEYYDDEMVRRIFVSGEKEVERCPYERYFHDEITEQGECTIDQHFGPYSKDERILQEFIYGQPVKKDP